MIRVSSRELVDKFADSCAGAHYSNSKSLGKTTMAYGLKSNSATCQHLVEHMAKLQRKNILFNVSNNSSTEALMLQGLWNIETQRMSGRSGLPLLSHLHVTVRGSMVDSISTLCILRGVFLKTPVFLSLESNLIMNIISHGTHFGKVPVPGTLSDVFSHEARLSRIRANPTFRDLFMEAGAIRSQAMATAALGVINQYSVVKRGFDDSGARFRDNASRKLAQESYERTVFNFVFQVKI